MSPNQFITVNPIGKGPTCRTESSADKLLFSSPNQGNAQIPYETSVGTASVVAMRGNSASAPFALKIQQVAPGIFAGILNQDGTVNGSDHPAAPGSTLQMFLTGLGRAAPSRAPANAAAALRVTIGGQTVRVLSAGLAPGLVGVFEAIPGVPELPSAEYPLVIEADGVPSNSVTVRVGP